jgi:hypothetical protein
MHAHTRSPWGILFLCTILALTACGSRDDTVSDQTLPVDLSVELEVQSLDGSQTFTVPRPGDPEWEDFLEMLDHPQFKSRLQGQPGYARVYDPEWRAAVRGYRDAPDSGMDLMSAFADIEGVAREFLAGIQMNDYQYLQMLRIDELEFEKLVWPSTPQSRPVLRIDWREAWGSHVGHCTGGAQQILDELGGRELELKSIQQGETKDYGQFRIINDVLLTLADPSDGSRIQVKTLDSVIERNGRYKGFIYKD